MWSFLIGASDDQWAQETQPTEPHRHQTREMGEHGPLALFGSCFEHGGIDEGGVGGHGMARTMIYGIRGRPILNESVPAPGEFYRLTRSLRRRGIDAAPSPLAPG